MVYLGPHGLQQVRSAQRRSVQQTHPQALCNTVFVHDKSSGAELTPIQRWFFEKNFTDKHHWNQSVMLHAKDGFDPEITEKTLHVLTVHHDALRMIVSSEILL
jgi:hypothetical protein